jgi:hypothetical protein
MRSVLAVIAVVLMTVGAAGEREISSVFFISKSQNRNQVHYAIKVDASCRPRASTPVRAYWLMREKGPDVTEALLQKEQRGYGIAQQKVEGSAVRMSIGALPAREILIQTWQSPNGACLSAATTDISGSRARLYNVHVCTTTFGAGVDSILLTGWRDDGLVVRERVKH